MVDEKSFVSVLIRCYMSPNMLIKTYSMVNESDYVENVE